MPEYILWLFKSLKPLDCAKSFEWILNLVAEKYEFEATDDKFALRFAKQKLKNTKNSFGFTLKKKVALFFKKTICNAVLDEKGEIEIRWG